MRLRELSLCLLVAFTGCSAHRVTIPDPPSKSAPLKERAKAYRNLAIGSGQETTAVRNGVPQGTSIDFVILGDGTRVVDARDLAPAVEPGSPTARYIAAIEARVQSAATVRAVLLVLAGVGTAALLAGIPVLSESRNSGLGIGLLAGGGGVAYLALQSTMFTFGAAYGPDRASAFLTYNKSLAERLGLLEEDDHDSPPLNLPSARLLPRTLPLVAQH